MSEATRSDRPLAVYADPGELDPLPGIKHLADAGFAVRVVGSDAPEDIAQQAPDATVLLIGYTPVDADLLARLPQLRLICTQSAGVDTVDLPAARAAGVQVANVPGAATEEVATHAFAMIAGLLRGLPFLGDEVRGGGWDATAVPTHRLSEVTVGVFGMGRIGRLTAQLLVPVVGKVAAYDPWAPSSAWPEGVERVGSLEAILGDSQVLTLHAPLTEDTRNVIGAAQLAAMPAGSYLVNVARGELVDFDALVAALDSGHLTGAALDVLPVEPPTDERVRTHDRLWVTPHAGYLSPAAARDYVLHQARNASTWLATGKPLEPVTG
ncbi:C-terminal binding protein [Nocardioides sp. SYSU DS0663]|uniref:C-terminal binding protein n=1 Tax=Nocardioides sp. SYSU DS0663 TaxID=3416445 RepID=UPI003F4B19AC